jgi:hypothetical protein
MLTYYILNDTIVLNLNKNNKTIIIPIGDDRYEKVLKLLEENELEKAYSVSNIDRAKIKKVKRLLGIKKKEE